VADRRPTRRSGSGSSVPAGAAAQRPGRHRRLRLARLTAEDYRGRASADQLGGPIRIAQVAGQVATSGFTPILRFVALISVSIGLLNLFPIPLLDGGHLLFYAIEAVRGRPLSDRAQEYGFRFGLAVVLLLMLFATYNDLLHIRSLFSL